MSTHDDQPHGDATASPWAAPGSGQEPTPPATGWVAPGAAVPASGSTYDAAPGTSSGSSSGSPSGTFPGWTAPTGSTPAPPAYPAQPSSPGAPAYPSAYPAPYPAAHPGHYGALTQDVGIVPLRPLDLGAILGGAFRLLRFNPKAALGFSAVAQVLGLLVVLPLMWLVAGRMAGRFSASFDDGAASTTYDDSGQSLVDSLMSNLGELPSSFVTAVAGFLLAVVVSRAVIGEKVSIGEAWRQARPSLWRFLGLELLGLLGLVLLIGLGALLVYAELWPLLVVLAVTAVVLGVWLLTRLAFASTALVLERAGIVTALRRSWALTRGAFWRVFGIRLLAGLLVGMIAAAITFPVSVLAMGIGFATAFGDGDPSGMFVATVLGSTVASAIGAAVTTPLSVGVDTLLYIDQRMRREGLDVDLARVVAARTTTER